MGVEWASAVCQVTGELLGGDGLGAAAGTDLAACDVKRDVTIQPGFRRSRVDCGNRVFAPIRRGGAGAVHEARRSCIRRDPGAASRPSALGRPRRRAWCRDGRAGTPARTRRSAPRGGHDSAWVDRIGLARQAASPAVRGTVPASARDDGCRGNRSGGCAESHPAVGGSGSGG